jgi:hypothetical protein
MTKMANRVMRMISKFVTTPIMRRTVMKKKITNQMIPT